MSTTQINSNNIQPSALANIGNPTISAVTVANSSYVGLNDTAVDTNGGYVILTGSKFTNTTQVYINNTTLATSVTYVSSTQLNVQVPATAAGSYALTVVNTNGTYCLLPNGITFSPVDVTWVTGSTLTPFQTGTSVSIQLNATGASGYQVQAGSSLPTGLSMTSAGLITGSVTVASDTTFSFTIEAYDAELQDAPKTFSLTITLNPPVPSSVEYLIVAGGGSGGSEGNNVGAGGGGAGGLLTGTATGISSGVAYTITVGAGGTAITATQGVGNQGGNSSMSGTGFTTITAVGGGAGGRGPNTAGNGGSGGGTAGGSGTVGKGVYPGSTYISATRQGYDGALGVGTYGGTTCSAGGGGGSSGAGQTGASSSVQGAGGAGTSSSISGSAVTYAAGGAGGAAAGGAGTSAGVNTGNGGGGAGGVSNTSGGGGSGIVILRYSDIYAAASATTGSPTITVAGGYRVYKFTGSGSITF